MYRALFVRGPLTLVIYLCLASTAFALASITGVIRDASGAVLPGVTVEAASPALIEKVRTVVSDANGIYRVVDLRPGAYTVTFTLPGFATVKREGIELLGSQTASVNIEMRVGAVEETVTVTGEAPIVDVQSVTRQHVMDRKIIETVPFGRRAQYLAALIPGTIMTNTGSNGAQDVGGSTAAGQSRFRIHGGVDQVIAIDGNTVNVHGPSSGFFVNVGSAQEVNIDTSGVSGEHDSAEITLNVIPREGGEPLHRVDVCHGGRVEAAEQQLRRRSCGARRECRRGSHLFTVPS